MALTVDDLKTQCNIDGTADDAVLTRLLSTATKHVERSLGFALTDTDQLPDGAPEDLEHAVLMLAADWYENREASLIGVSGQAVPFGVRDIINNYRRYTFGLSDDA
tara:strand:- start:8791 stop:9108 length:318 start_codon:yes stop_codon:yes gene_type:complete